MRIPSRAPVVVGVNGTAAGLAAVRLAAREALSRGRLLRVVHAFTWPSQRPPGAGVAYGRARRTAAQLVDEAVIIAQRSTPGVRVTRQLVDGAPDDVLLRLSRTAELLVVGDDDLATRPWLPPSALLVQVAARSWCPVVVARGPRPPGGPVLVAVDGSDSSLLALRYAALEGRRHAVPIEVVHVVPEVGTAEEAGQRVLVAALAAVPELVRVRTRLLVGSADQTLVRASGHARLAVLGPRGVNGAGLLGSVAREMLHRGACPTAFVHGPPVPGPRRPASAVQAVPG